MESDGRNPRVLICDRIADSGLELLRQHATIEIKTGLKPAELLEIIGNYQGVVVRSATKITAEVIKRGRNLKVIGRAGSGLDNIDVVAAQKKGVQVVNCPDANTRAVAEHTMALLLALARHLPRADSTLKEGRWEKSQLMGTGLFGKTLGIIGFGRIGREVAIRAEAFGMKILVNQRRPTPELNLEANITSVDLIELLQQSDFVSLHVPAKVETQNLIGAEQLALMKSGAYLVNTARGTVVDEAALLEALDKGTIAGAALDVFVKEPATHSALAQHERVVATPHISASTEDAQQLAAVTVAQKVIDIIRTVPVENPLSLRVVPLDQVYPHESVDPHRVERLVARLTNDGILSNPPIVVDTGNHYVVLDGATRVTALKQLQLPHAIVQVVSPEDGIDLHTWHHAVRELSLPDLLHRLQNLTEISLKETDSDHVLNEMVEYGGLCYIKTVENRVYLVKPAPEVNHLYALNRLTESYIEAGHVTRVLNSNITTLQNEYADLSALIVFPAYTVAQVLQIAAAGLVVPAGITRFIIPGRVLRMNIDLNFLKSEQLLLEKNEWLRQFVIDKLGHSQARYYAEPVYLLDE